jgi:vacuolar-type H+-ATPase subunit H
VTPMEILHEIVKAEHEAQKLYDEAIRRQEGFAAYLESKKTRIREASFRKADTAIAQAKSEQERAANEKIAELDRKLEYELDSARRSFEANKESYAGQIFDMVVGNNA